MLLYLQIWYCIYKHCILSTNMVLYLQTLYSIYKHGTVSTNAVFYLQISYFGEWQDHFTFNFFQNRRVIYTRSINNAKTLITLMYSRLVLFTNKLQEMVYLSTKPILHKTFVTLTNIKVTARNLMWVKVISFHALW